MVFVCLVKNILFKSKLRERGKSSNSCWIFSKMILSICSVVRISRTVPYYAVPWPLLGNNENGLCAHTQTERYFQTDEIIFYRFVVKTFFVFFLLYVQIAPNIISGWKQFANFFILKCTSPTAKFKRNKTKQKESKATEERKKKIK